MNAPYAMFRGETTEDSSGREKGILEGSLTSAISSEAGDRRRGRNRGVAERTDGGSTGKGEGGGVTGGWSRWSLINIRSWPVIVVGCMGPGRLECPSTIRPFLSPKKKTDLSFFFRSKRKIQTLPPSKTRWTCHLSHTDYFARIFSNTRETRGWFVCVFRRFIFSKRLSF